MLDFQHCFTPKAIIKTLCKYRIKEAKKKHKYHLLRDVSLHPKSVLFLNTKHNCPPELKELFPSRRSWQRPNAEERRKFNNTQSLNIYALYKTVISVHVKVITGTLPAPIWYVKLQSFIQRIQERALTPDNIRIQTPVIKPVKKADSKSPVICRPISLNNLEDRIIISFTAKYLTDIFDPYLHDSSYAFRSASVTDLKTHHDTILKLCDYRNERFNTDIFVAECDLEKFFDCLNHKKIIEAFEKFIVLLNSKGIAVNINAQKIFYQYLDSYAFNKDVYPLNGTSYFHQYNINDGIFGWPIERLKKEFYNEDIEEERIGVPQGGALSCLIANLLLHEVDEAVDLTPKDIELLYLRFCDDMVILHTDKTACNGALERYKSKVKSLKLLIHTPEVIEVYNKAFWKAKSKSPYKWAKNDNIANRVPWLSFVGYQIRYDGLIRVRKQSLQKEAQKQKTEMLDVLKALNIGKRNGHKANEHSRKSLKQQLFALENRLISMSVGRVELYNYRSIKADLCWTNGFKCLTHNFISRAQCRFLDSNRNRNLMSFKKLLKKLDKPSQNVEIKYRTYLGHPFSYHSFLMKSK